MNKLDNPITQTLIIMGILTIAIAVVLLGTGCGTSYAVQGAKGDPGSVGPSGPSGERGSPGLNADPIGMVKLCPGVTTYPSVFVEYAFCVSGNLYATYSSKGGFTTVLPPGRYSSNAIGSSCSFTVVSGCNINN